jgi:hypothetical protein
MLDQMVDVASEVVEVVRLASAGSLWWRCTSMSDVVVP